MATIPDAAASPLRANGGRPPGTGEKAVILDPGDAELRHGYCFRDVRRLAGYAAHRSYWQLATPAQDRFDLAVSAIAEFLVTAESRPGKEDLVKIGVQAINRDMTARLRQEGIDYSKPGYREGPNMPSFCTYWWPHAGYVGSHENGIIEETALFQILPRLKPAHRDVIVALARHGTYDKAAASLGRARKTFETYLSAARKEFLRLWHEGERPSRIWGHDFFGIEGYERDETITVRTLHQRTRRKKAKSNGLRPGT
jgi:hypothetical protein